MNKSNKHKKPNLFRFPLGGTDKLRADKARLEAFLDAVPGEYCGWSPDGMAAFSEGFCTLLGLESVDKIDDIENALSPGDAAALEGLFTRLQEEGQAFSLIVQTSDHKKTLRLSGSRGQDLEKEQRFDILWLEDITDIYTEKESAKRAQDQAETERDQLQNALDQIPYPLWMRDQRTDIIWCNHAYADTVDATPATVIAEQVELLLKPVTKGVASKQPGKDIARKVIDIGESKILPARLIIKGKRHLMNIFEIPLLAQNMTLGLAQDVTREEELKTEHNRYASANRELLEQLGSAIAIYNAEHQIEFYNSAYAQLWGLEDRWLDSRPTLEDIMEKLREARRLPEQADFRVFKKSWIDMFISLLTPHEDMLYLPDGTALRMLAVPHPMGGLMMTFEDVSSRLELESSYNTLIAVQKETLDNLAEGVAVYGGDGRLKLWNPSFGKLWGLHPEDLEGEPHITRIVEKMEPYFTKEEWKKEQKNLVAQSLDRKIHEGRMSRADNTLIAFSTVPLPDGGVLVTHIDVSDTAKVENALREKNAALEAAERLKLDFLANVSYQLRTPLSTIMGFSEILDNEYFGPLNKRQKEYTQGMGEAGNRLLNLINDILDLSTIEAGYLELELEEFSIKEMLEALRELTYNWAHKENIEVILDYPKNIGKTVADRRRLTQCLLNLIRNAISFTEGGGTITVSAKRRKNALEFSVTDEGTGIPEVDQERIFEPFERALSINTPEGKGARSGAGLGLTLVKNIVELHKGKVTLQSEEGKGTTVTILLP